MRRSIVIVIMAIIAFVSNAQTELNKIGYVSGSVKVENDSLLVEIMNNSDSTVFVFDAYLTPDIVRSKYLRRYNEAYNECFLSFLPIVPFLGPGYNDKLILGENRIINKNQTRYSFTEIVGGGTAVFKNPLSVIYSTDFVDYFNPRDIKPYVLRFQVFQHMPVFPSEITLQLAVYKDISILTKNNYSGYYDNEYQFYKQAYDYSVLSIPLFLHRNDYPNENNDESEENIW